MKKWAEPVTYTTTGAKPVTTVDAVIFGVLIAGDGVNNPTVEVTNGNSDVVIPSAAYDASALGLNGVMLSFGEETMGAICYSGITCTISGSGSRRVTVFYKDIAL